MTKLVTDTMLKRLRTLTAVGEDADAVAALLADHARLQDGIAAAAETARRWAVANGGNTPLALIATQLRKLLGLESLAEFAKVYKFDGPDASINAKIADIDRAIEALQFKDENVRLNEVLQKALTALDELCTRTMLDPNGDHALQGEIEDIIAEARRANG